MSTHIPILTLVSSKECTICKFFKRSDIRIVPVKTIHVKATYFMDKNIPINSVEFNICYRCLINMLSMTKKKLPTYDPHTMIDKDKRHDR